jgi:hypothetical protein
MKDGAHHTKLSPIAWHLQILKTALRALAFDSSEEAYSAALGRTRLRTSTEEQTTFDGN